ncbi:MAG TPA: hypothetical protein VIM73_16670 [Polyangiaceae bacterium]
MKLSKGKEGFRDQGLSVFSPILSRLCEASGALAAALVDGEGETVDYAGCVDPYDLRVAAAEWRLVLALAHAVARDTARGWAHAHEIVVRAQGKSFALRALTDGYALVVVLPRRAFRMSQRALAAAVEELRVEAGLCSLAPSDRLRWSNVEVRTAAKDPRRPDAVWHEGVWQSISILGRLDAGQLGRSEVGFLARAANGRELLLVREPVDHWFAADPL